MPLASLCLLCRQSSQRRLCPACERALDDLLIGRHRCNQCALPMNQGGHTCGRCLSNKPAFSAARIAYRYEFPLDYLIARYKFHGCTACGAVLSERFGHWLNLPSALQRPDLILPAPLHWRRLMARGFNQADHLARAASRATGIALGRRQIIKRRHTSSQHGLSRKDRLANIRGAFAAKGVHGLHIALVDDVVTTGTTAQEISRSLLKAGAASVQIWALARTPDDGS